MFLLFELADLILVLFLQRLLAFGPPPLVLELLPQLGILLLELADPLVSSV